MMGSSCILFFYIFVLRISNGEKKQNMSDLLRGLLLLLVLVALMAQLVGHLPARLCLLHQPVGHGFSLILQLPLLLEKEIK